MAPLIIPPKLGCKEATDLKFTLPELSLVNIESSAGEFITLLILNLGTNTVLLVLRYKLQPPTIAELIAP